MLRQKFSTSMKLVVPEMSATSFVSYVMYVVSSLSPSLTCMHDFPSALCSEVYFSQLSM
jgi:hypothetical protein